VSLPGFTDKGPRIEEVDVDTFLRFIDRLCRREKAILLNRMLLLLTNYARGNVFSYKFSETRMSEVHADGIEGADCSGMIKVVMVPCDDVR